MLPKRILLLALKVAAGIAYTFLRGLVNGKYSILIHNGTEFHDWYNIELAPSAENEKNATAKQDYNLWGVSKMALTVTFVKVVLMGGSKPVSRGSTTTSRSRIAHGKVCKLPFGPGCLRVPTWHKKHGSTDKDKYWLTCWAFGNRVGEN